MYKVMEVTDCDKSDGKLGYLLDDAVCADEAHLYGNPDMHTGSRLSIDVSRSGCYWDPSICTEA